MRRWRRTKDSKGKWASLARTQEKKMSHTKSTPAPVEDGSKLNGFTAWPITKKGHNINDAYAFMCLQQRKRQSLFSILFRVFLLVFDKKKSRKIEIILNGCIRIYFSISKTFFLFHAGRLKSSSSHTHELTHPDVELLHDEDGQQQTIVHLLNGRWKYGEPNSGSGTQNSLPHNEKKKELWRGQMAFCVLSVRSFLFFIITFILDLSLFLFRFESVLFLFTFICVRIIFIVIAIDIPFESILTLLESHTPAQCVPMHICCA